MLSLKKHILLLAAWLMVSITVPAQNLPPLPLDGRIQTGTLGCGVKYYMVQNPAEKGYASVAVVQRDEPSSPEKRSRLNAGLLAGFGIGSGREGYITEWDGSTVYRFSHVPFYNVSALDSTLLHSFTQVAASRAEQAIIICGDIDTQELKKKLDIFSMMVPRILVRQDHTLDYVWEPSPAPSVLFYRSQDPVRASVSVSYASARIPQNQMNTAQALVTNIFLKEFTVILRHRLEREFADAGIPCGGIEFDLRSSARQGDDELYRVSVITDPAHLDPAMRLLSSTLSQLDYFGVPETEFANARRVMLPSMLSRAAATPPVEADVDRCVSNFLYGAAMSPFSEELRLFSRKHVTESDQCAMFNSFSSAVLDQLGNLTLSFVSPQDSLDRDDALFYYNLAYLYGSLSPTDKDYSWRAADTLGLEIDCPRVRIRSTRTEPVSGGTLWTLSNGVKVVYKQMDGIFGRFKYAFQLDGGLSHIPALQDGEAGYIADMLSLYDAGGLPARSFRDLLEVHGVRMSAHVDMNNLLIEGEAPSPGLPFLLKSLLSIFNDRTINRREFEAYSRNMRLAATPLRDSLESALAPSYPYFLHRNPALLTTALQDRAEAYFNERFTHVNNGVLILVGDLDEPTVKRVLMRYLGGFQTNRGTVQRQAVTYSPASASLTGESREAGVHILVDAPLPLSTANYIALPIVREQVHRALVRRLQPLGISVSESFEPVAYPTERLRLFISCEPVSADGLPAGEYAIPAHTVLQNVRLALEDVSSENLSQADIRAWRNMVYEQVRASQASAGGVLDAVVMRYTMGKDIYNRYAETLAGIDSSRIHVILSALARAPRVEYVALP